MSPKPICNPALPSLSSVKAPAGYSVVDTPNQVWALYAASLGYFGGRAFENAAWKGLLLALGTGFAIAGLVEAIRWVLRRRQGRNDPG